MGGRGRNRISDPLVVIQPWNPPADLRVCSKEHLAEHIPDAKHVEVDGTGIYPFVEDADRILAEIAEFVTGEAPVREVARVLATIMFTDIVGSTERAVAAGMRRGSGS